MNLGHKNQVIEGLISTTEAQQKLIKKYEEALKFYAYDAMSLKDDGKIARTALGE